MDLDRAVRPHGSCTYLGSDYETVGDQNPLLKGRLSHSLDLWACFEDTERYVDVSVHPTAGTSYWEPSDGHLLAL